MGRGALISRPGSGEARPCDGCFDSMNAVWLRRGMSHNAAQTTEGRGEESTAWFRGPTNRQVARRGGVTKRFPAGRQSVRESGEPEKG